MRRYEVYLTSKASKFVDRMKKRYRLSFHRIKEALEELAIDPYHNTRFLKAPEYRGKRKLRVGTLRIVFAVCEECRREGHRVFNVCIDCDDMADNVIKVFEIEFRGKIY